MVTTGTSRNTLSSCSTGKYNNDTPVLSPHSYNDLWKITNCFSGGDS